MLVYVGGFGVLDFPKKKGSLCLVFYNFRSIDVLV